MNNEYLMYWLVRQRLQEAERAADEARLLGAIRPARTPLRRALGARLVRLGQALLATEDRNHQPVLSDPRRP